MLRSGLAQEKWENLTGRMIVTLKLIVVVQMMLIEEVIMTMLFLEVLVTALAEVILLKSDVGVVALVAEEVIEAMLVEAVVVELAVVEAREEVDPAVVGKVPMGQTHHQHEIYCKYENLLN